ncbi:MAG TPA: MFS transporter [Novosphingobium sp.]
MPSNANPGSLPASQEWRRYWLLVFAGMVGMSVGTLPTATLGLFMQPLGDEFGWSRTEISIGLSIFALVSMPLAPFAGILVDRFGARRVALPGLLLSGTCFAAFGLMSGPYYQWVLIWVAYTLASLMTRTLVWGSSISAAFSNGRGLALAVMLCGSAIATAIGPTVARLLIETWGWRGGYVGLGVGWAGMALILAMLFFHDVTGPAARAGNAAASETPRELPGGLTLREAVRTSAIQRIALAMFLQAMMGAAIMVHIVPMLTADGLSAAEATTIAAVLGIASITGKLVTGGLIDRIPGSLLPVIAYGGPGVAYVLLLQAEGSVGALAFAVFVLGYCSGAAMQLATYLTTRYAGLRNFGAIFGVVSSLMACGAGIGPVLSGWVFDTTGGYSLLLTAGIPAAVIAALAVFRLGAYPVFAPAMPEASPSEKPVPAT